MRRLLVLGVVALALAAGSACVLGDHVSNSGSTYAPRGVPQLEGVGPGAARAGSPEFGPGPSTRFGQTIADFERAPRDFRLVSAHAEEATGRAYRGGLSVEEVYERGGETLVRHRICGPEEDILHETYRPYAKFGAP